MLWQPMSSSDSRQVSCANAITRNRRRHPTADQWVIVFPLVADCKDGNGVAVLDLEQRDIVGGAKWNDKFAQQRCIRLCLAAAEWGFSKKRQALGDGVARSTGSRMSFFSTNE